jgi:hypothetical protein
VELLESRLVPSTIDHGGGFASHSDLASNGSANFSGSVAQLTNAAVQNQAGSIFTNTTYDITQFSTQFTFVQNQFSTPSGSGLTFTIQNVASTALGAYGDGLGYRGINNSVAIKFDIFDNAGEGPNSTGIFTDGRNPTVRQIGLPSQFPDESINLTAIGSGIDLHSGHTFQVTLSYSGGTLGETIRDLNTGVSFQTSYSVDIASIIGSNTAFLGFTGSTGTFTSTQGIQTWQGTFGSANTNVPTISSLSPTSVREGSGQFMLTVNGSNYMQGSLVQWTENGKTTPLTTFFLSGSQLLATVQSSLVSLGNAGLVSVVVSNGSSNSNPASFTITPFSTTTPFIASLSPTSIQEGSNSFPLTISGSGFASNARVQWTQNTTTFLLAPSSVSSNQVQVSIPNFLVSAGHAGTVSVSVSQTINNSTQTSNTVPFTITSATSGPFISSINPTSVQAGSGGFTLTVNGSNFIPGAVVQWTANGTTTPLGTTFLSINGIVQLIASVNSSLVASPGTALISVTQGPTGNMQTSNSVPFAIGSGIPGPVISSIIPSSAEQGSPSFDLSVTGSNLATNATVQWTPDGSTTPISLPTSSFIFNGSVALVAIVDASLVTAPGTASITVTQTVNNSTQISNALTFTITPNSAFAPVITSLSPSSVQAGSSGLQLTVGGANFTSSSVVQWTPNGFTTPIPLQTTFVSNANGTLLLAAVPSGLLGTPGTASVTVSQNTQISNAFTFTITPTTAASVIASLSPSSAPAGSSGLQLTVGGANFTPSSVVQWTPNGATTPISLVTTYVSNANGTQLLAAVPSSLLATQGTASVTVSQNTLISNAFTFTITPSTTPVPVITSLSPSSVQAGSSNLQLTVNGSNFTSNAIVQWTPSGSSTPIPLQTTFVSTANGTQLLAFVPSSLLAAPGTALVTVSQIVHGNTLTSNAFTFTITPSTAFVPVITSISPSTVQAGSSSLQLTVSGANFASNAVVQWTPNGSTIPIPLPTTYVSTSNGTLLLATVPSSLLATSGTASVTVSQVVNGSTLISNAFVFTITPVSTSIVATGLNISATVNVAQDFRVAQFTDLAPNAQPGAYAVSVNFGDGTPLQAGNVTQPGGSGTTFFVDATHTYTQTGTFTVQVQIFTEVGRYAATSSTATVTAAGGGGSAALVGQNPLQGTIGVQAVELGSPLTASLPTAKPIQSSASAQSGQPSSGDDLYWQLVGQGAGISYRYDWAPDALAASLEGISI